MIRKIFSLLALLFAMLSAQAQDVSQIIKFMYGGYHQFMTEDYPMSGLSSSRTANSVLGELRNQGEKKTMSGVTYELLKTDDDKAFVKVTGDQAKARNFQLQPSGSNNELFKGKRTQNIPFLLFEEFSRHGVMSDVQLEELSEEEGSSLLDKSKGIVIMIQASGNIQKVLICQSPEY